MKAGVCMILYFIFLLLSLLHFYWAMEGTWWFKESLPTTSEGKQVLNPTVLDCVIVGFFLMSFSGFYFLASGYFSFDLSYRLTVILKWVIPLLFLLRSIGEFKYVGFFKKVVGTEFSRWDTLIYSPLCLMIAFLGFLFIKVD